MSAKKESSPRARFIHAVNRVHDFRSALSQLTGEDYGDGQYKIFCPFHDDRNNPSAQLYDHDMFCFTCWQKYSAYDVLKKLGKSDEELREGLPDILPDAPPSNVRPFFNEELEAEHILYIAGERTTAEWSKCVADRVRFLRRR